MSRVLLTTAVSYRAPSWQSPQPWPFAAASLQVPRIAFRGLGYFAGEAPSDPASPDGRTKVLGVPASVRVQICEAESGRVLDEFMSNADGTWRSNQWSPDYWYMIRGLRGDRPQNDAVQGWQKPQTPP